MLCACRQILLQEERECLGVGELLQEVDVLLVVGDRAKYVRDHHRVKDLVRLRYLALFTKGLDQIYDFLFKYARNLEYNGVNNLLLRFTWH